jgi:hypothetical protein
VTHRDAVGHRDGAELERRPTGARTPSLAAAVSRRIDALHGVISFHDDAMPTCGLSQSSSVRPTARSIAREAAFWMPSVTSRERGLTSTAVAIGRQHHRRRSVPHPHRFVGGGRHPG